MELLRRALLIGCLLPGLWLLWLAPLDPLLSVVPVDFEARQKREAAAAPPEGKTEAEQRRDVLPLSVYIEEVLQYNVFSAVGPEWDRILGEIDRLRAGGAPGNGLRGRTSPDPADTDGPVVFFRADEEPFPAVLDKLAAAGGTTYVSISRPGGDRHYRVDRRAFTRADFRPGAGFTGRPAPPAWLLRPFRMLGLGCVLAGLAFFALFPRPGEAPPGGSRLREAAALGVGLLCFAAPLVAVGGSVQALTRGSVLTLPLWLLAFAGMHVFAGPARYAPDPLDVPSGGAGRLRFAREGLVFLAMSFGPLAFLVCASLTLWDR
jgi:hypothetical protein